MSSEQNSNITSERLLELNQRIAYLYRQRTLTVDETEKQELTDQIDAAADEINNPNPNANMPFGRRATNQTQASSSSGSTTDISSSAAKPPSAPKKSKNPAPSKPDSSKNAGNKNVPPKIEIPSDTPPNNETRRPSSELSPNYIDKRRPSNFQEQIDYLVKIGKGREEAISIVNSVSVRRKMSVGSKDLEFAVYYVTDGDFSDRRELLQLNMDEGIISLHGGNAPIFELDVLNLKSVTPMDENRILLKTIELEGYELKMESETSQSELHEALKVLNPKLGKRKISFEGILEKKSPLGWSAKDVKLEDGHLLYKIKGKKGQYLGLIEIQTSDVIVQKVPKIPHQFRIETRDGKSYNFRDPNKNSKVANEWVHKLKQCVEDGKKQLSFRGPKRVQNTHLSVHFENYPRIEQLLSEIQNEIGNATKVNELRWQLHEILSADQRNTENDMGRELVQKMASVRGRVSTMLATDADDTDSLTTSSDPINQNAEYDIGVDNDTLAEDVENSSGAELGSNATIQMQPPSIEPIQSNLALEQLKKSGRFLGSGGHLTAPTVKQLRDARSHLTKSYRIEATSDDENYDTFQNQNDATPTDEDIDQEVPNGIGTFEIHVPTTVQDDQPSVPQISIDSPVKGTSVDNTSTGLNDNLPKNTHSPEEPINYLELNEEPSTQPDTDIYEVPNFPILEQQQKPPEPSARSNKPTEPPTVTIKANDIDTVTAKENEPETSSETRGSENYIETSDVSVKPNDVYEDITKGPADAENQTTDKQVREPSDPTPKAEILNTAKVENEIKEVSEAVKSEQRTQTEKLNHVTETPDIYSDISNETEQTKPKTVIEPTKPEPEKEKQEIGIKTPVPNSRPTPSTKTKAPQAPAPPVPQPPPRPGFFSRFRTQAPQIRQIQFIAITSPDSINHAIWSTKDQSESRNAVDLDESERAEIFELFRLQSAKKQVALEAVDAKTPDKKYGGYSIGGPREQRLEMFFKIHSLDKAQDVFMKFFELEDKTKQATFISELKFLQPTNIDIEFFTKHRSEFDSSTGITYWQMSSLCEDKHYSDKVEILKTINEIQDQGYLISSNLKKVIDSCTVLQNSEQFSTLLIYCLKLINFINESNSRPPVQAFSIVETLPKFSQAKSTARSNYTMLNALVGFVQKHDPQILDKLGEIRLQGVDVLSPQGETNPGQKPIKKSKDLFPVLSSPVKLMSIMFRDAQGCIDKMKRTSHDIKLASFVEKASHVLRVECECTLKILESEVTNLHTQYEQLMKHLGQERNTDPGQFFFDVNKFLRDFWQVRRDMSNPLFTNSNHAQNVRKYVQAELDNKLRKMGSIDEKSENITDI